MADRKHILFQEDDIGPEWIVTYHLGYSEFDDDLDGTDTEEITLNALDFETAAKYAQQYLRKMQINEDTSSAWSDAQILSVELRG